MEQWIFSSPELCSGCAIVITFCPLPKMVLAALLLGAQHSDSRARTGQLSVSIMLLAGISCQSVWDVIFQ